MKNLKLLLVVFAMTFSSATKAEIKDPTTRDSVTVEIQRMLKEVSVAEKNDLEVTVFFSISEDQKIQNLRVASASKEVSRYLESRLVNKELPADWMKGKIYELTVVKRVS